MLDLAAAARIAYPLRDTVAADLANHLIEADREDAHAEAIKRIADEYVGTLHGRNSLRDQADVDAKLDALFACVMNSRTDCSIKEAISELYIAATLAATRLAVNDYRREIKQAEEDAAVAAWERRQERCEAWV